MPAFLDHADPRLGLRCAQAELGDPMTRSAIRLLGDALAQLGDVVMAAPAFGLPVRVIACRVGATTTYLLNPGIKSLGAVDLSIAELSPHTGALRRNVRRAKTIVLEGTDLSGAPHVLDLAEAAAVQAQQALDLMDRPAPFDWLKPFHHMIMREGDAARRGMFLTLNAGIYAATPHVPAGETLPEASGLRFAAENTVTMHPDTSGAALTEIDAADPTRPVNPRHRGQLAVMAARPAGQNVLFGHVSQIDLALASVLLFRGLRCHVTSTPAQWPQVAVDQLGLAPVLRRMTMDVAQFSELPAGVAALDSIVIDAVQPTTALPDEQALRRIARALSGAAGALMISVTAPNPVLEDHLQSVFPALYGIEVAPDHLIYLAQKTPLDVGQARAQLMTRATATGMRFLTDLLGARWLHLRKDGQRELL